MTNPTRYKPALFQLLRKHGHDIKPSVLDELAAYVAEVADAAKAQGVGANAAQ
jgi:L-lactate utilization protein LutB